MPDAPVILWIRREFRLTDHPALDAAVATGAPVIPLFVLDEVADGYGAAPKWRLEQAIRSFAERLDGVGARLVLRRGRAAEVVSGVAREAGAGAVHWTRAYDPDGRARDEAVKDALGADGIETHVHGGHLLYEPWTVETNAGSYYKVYTPYWRSVAERSPGDTLTAPSEIRTPGTLPDSDALEDWALGAAMDRGAPIVARHANVGEAAAQQRLATFVQHRVADYAEARDFPGRDGTSSLSENLSWGEISTRACWHAGQRAREEDKDGALDWVQELVWREFAYHLMWHTPRITTGNWREDWDAFPWNEDERLAEVKAWKQGRTGIRFVDAAMREMYATGRMHNRARMIVASYLTKNLMCHWRIGQKWFEHCLIDWDVASNAMGWQWSAGSGPDATPFFRVFNPVTQLDKYDPDRAYTERWIAEGADAPHDDALSYFDAIPRSWPMSADDAYPEQVVGPKEGRERALEAYNNRNF